jgi:hypothetical protein
MKLDLAMRELPETGLLLLAELCRLHGKAVGVSIDWELSPSPPEISVCMGRQTSGAFALIVVSKSPYSDS